MNGPFAATSRHIGGRSSQKKVIFLLLLLIVLFMVYEKHLLNSQARTGRHRHVYREHRDHKHEEEHDHSSLAPHSHGDDGAKAAVKTSGKSKKKKSRAERLAAEEEGGEEVDDVEEGTENEDADADAEAEDKEEDSPFRANTKKSLKSKKKSKHQEREDKMKEAVQALDDVPIVGGVKRKKTGKKSDLNRGQKKEHLEDHEKHQQKTSDEEEGAQEEAEVPRYELDIDTLAKEKAVCPLPVLHPEKWQSKMTWGVRKEFSSCGRDEESGGPFSRLVDSFESKNDILNPHKQRQKKEKKGEEEDPEREELEEDPVGDKAVVIVDGCKLPKSKIKVFGFKELLDDHFVRLSSTMDAETRQNDLKSHFAVDRAKQFGTELKLLTGSAGEDSGGQDEDDHRYHAEVPADIPYALVECGKEHELHIRSIPLVQQHPKKGSRQRTKQLEMEEKRRNQEQKVGGEEDGGEEDVPPPRIPKKGQQIKNFLHIMVDSTSLYALRRDAKKVVQWMEDINNKEDSPSYVYPFKHYHAVSCCSPGNQIPVYSGNLNGEGDHFVRSEPKQDSSDWLWNIAARQGFKTFWSLDNCPDKSARDYHAYPSVDERVVAPLCLAGVLLSHKDQTCLAGKTVDSHVIDGLTSFWKRNEHHSKFAAIQFITPHEESEKLLIELDILLERFFKTFVEGHKVLEDTAIFFWSDHGINFGKYASTHDGEIEKMYPFANLILPRWWVGKNGAEVNKNLRRNQDLLATPYDMYEIARDLLYYPAKPPTFRHDKHNPPLPKPTQSHIIASFQKDITPVNLMREELSEKRDCWHANIPMEFCTCIQWKSTEEKRYRDLVKKAIEFHKNLVKDEEERCESVSLDEVVSVELQKWPTEYHPKEQRNSKQIWMKPNRDMVRVQYRTASPGAGLFEASFSIAKNDPQDVDLAHIDRLDAMKRKCGIVQKQVEHMCVCKQNAGDAV